MLADQTWSSLYDLAPSPALRWLVVGSNAGDTDALVSGNVHEAPNMWESLTLPAALTRARAVVSCDENRFVVGGAAPGVSVQVGGSIGVAALGSVLSSVYMSNIKPILAGLPGLPDHIIDAAKDSVGGAMVVAEQLPPAIAETLRTAAHNSFMDGWRLLALIGCAIAAVGAIMVFRFMPARPIETVSGD